MARKHIEIYQNLNQNSLSIALQIEKHNMFIYLLAEQQLFWNMLNIISFNPKASPSALNILTYHWSGTPTV